MEKTYHILKTGDGNKTQCVFFFLEYFVIIKLGGFLMNFNYPKKYTYMPKITKVTSPSDPRWPIVHEEIECYLPVVCYVVTKRENYNPDGTSFIDYDVLLSRDKETLEEKASLEKKEAVTRKGYEVSDDYDEIFTLCTEKNEELLRRQFTLDQQLWKEIQDDFYNRQANYIMKVEEPLTEENKERRM